MFEFKVRDGIGSQTFLKYHIHIRKGTSIYSTDAFFDIVNLQHTIQTWLISIILLLTALQLDLKLSCDSRFQRAFTACSYVFKIITLVSVNQLL